jgi:hypothetical protein
MARFTGVNPLPAKLRELPLWMAEAPLSAALDWDEMKLRSTLPSTLSESQNGRKASKPTPAPSPKVVVVVTVPATDPAVPLCSRLAQVARTMACARSQRLGRRTVSLRAVPKP